MGFFKKEQVNMTVKERVRYCRVIEKMELHAEYTKKLGLKNNSNFYDRNKIYYDENVKCEVVK